MMLNGLQELKEQEGAHYTEMCDVTGLAYSSVNRWRGRSDKGLEPIMAPGPKKVEPLDIEGLENRIMHLHHRRKRSYGTGDLFMEFASQMSRRGLSAMVTEARTEKNRQLRESQYRIRWLCPGLVWSMDDTEQKHEGLGEKVSIHSTRDLSSKYMFDPLLDLDLAKGPEIAENLNTLFKKHEPPLFMKRDWGKNLNHRDVNAVLSENMVIPVNSPAYYPQYNGGIEKGQYEIKSAVDFSECKDLRESTLAVRLGAHDLNHRRRRILSWQTPCQTVTGRFKTVS